jgi:hypothetical protein
LAKALSRQELLSYARAGAQARINQLRAELAALEAAFGGGRGRRAAGGKRAGGGAGKKRRMSAEGRKRIADAARRRWAKWRAENKKG